KVHEFDRHVLKPFRQRLARRVEILELPRRPQERADTIDDSVLTRQSRLDARSEFPKLLCARHPLEIALQRLDRLGVQVDRIEALELVAQELDLVRRKPRLRQQGLPLA